MISIDRLEEMTIEELQIKLKNFEEQIKLQNNFIDSLFKATNNSEWLDKSMLDDEVSEVIEKIELDYEQLDQLKAENDNLKSLIWWIHIGAEGADKATTEYYENRNTPYEENYWKRIRALQPLTYESKYKLALIEIKEIIEQGVKIHDDIIVSKQILQKISEVEDAINK